LSGRRAGEWPGKGSTRESRQRKVRRARAPAVAHDRAGDGRGGRGPGGGTRRTGPGRSGPAGAAPHARAGQPEPSRLARARHARMRGGARLRVRALNAAREAWGPRAIRPPRYSYYRRRFHFHSLHRDVAECELSVITCVVDTPGGGDDLLPFPDRCDEPLDVRATPRRERSRYASRRARRCCCSATRYLMP
jgi:hypothetical protein